MKADLRRNLGIGFLVFLAAWSAPGFSADQGAVGPHGGRILSDSAGSAEVSISRLNKTVEVFIPRYESNDRQPVGVHVTFFDQKNKGRTLVLRALPSQESPNGPSDPFIHFRGKLSPVLSSSNMGIELKIAFSKSAPLILRSERLEPGE